MNVGFRDFAQSKLTPIGLSVGLHRTEPPILRANDYGTESKMGERDPTSTASQRSTSPVNS